MIDSLYAYFKANNLEGFQEATRVVTVNKGARIYDVTDPFTDIFEIETGAVKLGKLSPRGEEYIYTVLTAGDIFGNTAFLPNTFTEFSKAVVPTKIYVYIIPPNYWTDFL